MEMHASVLLLHFKGTRYVVFRYLDHQSLVKSPALSLSKTVSLGCAKSNTDPSGELNRTVCLTRYGKTSVAKLEINGNVKQLHCTSLETKKTAESSHSLQPNVRYGLRVTGFVTDQSEYK